MARTTAAIATLAIFLSLGVASAMEDSWMNQLQQDIVTSELESFMQDVVLDGPPSGIDLCCVPGDAGSSCRNDPNHCSVACTDPSSIPPGSTECKNCQCQKCCSKNYMCVLAQDKDPNPGKAHCVPFCPLDASDQPCNGHGSCNTPNVCTCEAGWDAAKNCSTCLEGYYGPTCRACDGIEAGSEIPCSGHGACNGSGTTTGTGACTCKTHWTGTVCDTCESGYGPDPAKCDEPICSTPCEHGTCVAPNQCSCATGWKGSSCSEPDCSDENSCSGHGTCTAPNTCQCAAHWQGTSCSDCASEWGPAGKCNTPLCEKPCEHGTCSNDHKCTCDPGWSGSTCSEASCARVAGCSGHGSCVKPDVCNCTGHWTREDCSVCEQGWGPSTSCTEPICEGGCGHGKCTSPGHCECEPGWSGSSCSVATCNDNCSGHGMCVGPDQCVCDKDYQGKFCTVSKAHCCATSECSADEQHCNSCCAYPPGHPKACLDPEYDCKSCQCGTGKQGCCSNSYCNPVDGSSTEFACCPANRKGSHCSECAEGYYGPNCTACPGGVQNPCGGKERGTCNNGTCTCTLGYQGADCSACDPEVWVCPNNCSGHGACHCQVTASENRLLRFEEDLYRSKKTRPGTCSCSGNFEGASCSECKTGFAGKDCATCAPGYYGPSDGCKKCDCPGACNSKTGTCVTSPAPAPSSGSGSWMTPVRGGIIGSVAAVLVLYGCFACCRRRKQTVTREEQISHSPNDLETALLPGPQQLNMSSDKVELMSPSNRFSEAGAQDEQATGEDMQDLMDMFPDAGGQNPLQQRWEQESDAYTSNVTISAASTSAASTSAASQIPRAPSVAASVASVAVASVVSSTGRPGDSAAVDVVQVTPANLVPVGSVPSDGIVRVTATVSAPSSSTPSEPPASLE